MVMMMCGGDKKEGLSVRSAGNLHIYPHTPISVAEKIFVLNYGEAMNESSWSNFLCGKKVFIGNKGLIKGGLEMRKFGWLLGVIISFPLICVAQVEGEPTENPDEYRDCVVYTLEEANATTAPEGNQLIFTYSGFMTRAEVNNVDCGTIAYIDAPSSEGGSGGGGSIIGGGGSSSGNSGGSSGGNSGGTPSVDDGGNNECPSGFHYCLGVGCLPDYMGGGCP